MYSREIVNERPRTPSPPPAAPPPRRRSPRIGVLKGAALERLLIAAVQVGAWLLIALSVLGTFYGARGADAPITAPARIGADIVGGWPLLLLAGAGQGLLSLVQWGGRQLARRDRRWWTAYLGALGLSVWWNWAAYGDPLIAIGVPWLIAFGIVIGGDVFPELALVREAGDDG